MSFQINVGDEIELSLMRRDRNSLFAVPVDQYFPEINEKHPSISGPGNKSYSQVHLDNFHSCQFTNLIFLTFEH